MKHDFHLISLSNVFEQHKLIRYVVTCDCWDLNPSQKAIVMKCKKILSVCTFLHFSTRAAAVERSLEVCKQVSTRQALILILNHSYSILELLRPDNNRHSIFDMLTSTLLLLLVLSTSDVASLPLPLFALIMHRVVP